MSRSSALICCLAMGSSLEASECPTVPAVVSSISAPGGLLARAGHTVLVAAGSQLQLFSFANPSSPTHASDLALPAAITSLAAAGSHAYVGLADDRLAAIDVADPFAPNLVAFAQTACDRYLFALDDGCIQLCRDTGITSFHLSDVGELSPVSSFPSSSNFHSATQVADRVYVRDHTSQLRVFQLGHGSSLVPLPSIGLPERPEGLTSHGNELYVLLYITYNRRDLATYDLSDPDSPRLVQRLPTADFRAPVWIAGNLYQESEVLVPLASGEGYERSVRMFDLRRRDLLELDGMMLCHLSTGQLELRQPSPSYALPSAYDLQLSGTLYELAEAAGLAFVAAGESGVHVLELPEPPTWSRTVGTQGWSVDVDANESLVAVAEYDAGLRIFDPADLSGELATVHFATPVRSVALIADLAYVGVDDLGVIVIDLASASAPVEIFRLPMSGPISDLEISGERAAVSAHGHSLRILDLSDPRHPTVAHELAANRPVHLALSDDLLAVTYGYSGVAFYELSESGPPQRISTPSGGQVQGVRIADDLVYVTTATALRVYHRQQIQSAQGFIWTDGALLAANVSAFGDQVCYLGSTGLLRILDRPCLPISALPPSVVQESDPLLRTVFPNPSVGAVQIGLRPDLAGSLQLQCYDVRGRLVWRESYERAPASIHWNGRDLAGMPVAAGVYHLRLSTTTQVQSQSIVLLGEARR